MTHLHYLISVLFFVQTLFFASPLHSLLESILPQLPEWNLYPEQMKIESVEGGLTNQNYKVIFPNQSYFVRVGSSSSHLLGVDIEREYYSVKMASELGISPKIVAYDRNNRILATSFIESKPVQQNDQTYLKIIQTIQQFHQLNINLPSTFCPYQCIFEYAQHVAKKQEYITFLNLNSALLLAKEIQHVIPKFRQLRPCHLDLHIRNVLDDGNRLWIIDWEYSAMADPLYDIATWASTDFFSFEQMKELLELYLENPSSLDMAYFYLYSILADIRWGLWCLIQEEISPVKANYIHYAQIYFSSALEKALHAQYFKSIDLLNNVITILQIL